MYDEDVYKEFIGKTLTDACQGDDELTFTCDDGSVYRLYHEQGCCEDVHIEDIDGPLDVLIGSPITWAESVTNSDLPKKEEWDDSYTWTFIKFGTVKGSVTIRFYGTSNGYYSEDADFAKIKEPS